ncbi:MAG: OsmC family protein [Acidimicrobiia bacterium]|nr:OsmC family protein [Acidimicrobiia bacterium]
MHVEVTRVHGKRLEVTGADGRIIIDDLSADGGPGDGWRPTELVLAALGGCMVGTMLSFAADQGIAVGDVRMVLEDEVASPPKRIGRINMTMFVGGDVTDRQLESLKRVASKCKIGNTLADSPDLTFDLRRSL